MNVWERKPKWFIKHDKNSLVMEAEKKWTRREWKNKKEKKNFFAWYKFCWIQQFWKYFSTKLALTFKKKERVDKW